MIYTYTHLEDYIQRLYHSVDIYHPRQLDIETIASRLGLSITYAQVPSGTVDSTIIIDERLTAPEQWQEFGHELCHALWHTGNQLRLPLPFRQYQEWRADLFAQHLCIPTFMLQKIPLNKFDSENVRLIQETFKVKEDFSKRRYRNYKNRLKEIKHYEEKTINQG